MWLYRLLTREDASLCSARCSLEPDGWVFRFVVPRGLWEICSAGLIALRSRLSYYGAIGTGDKCFATLSTVWRMKQKDDGARSCEAAALNVRGSARLTQKPPKPLRLAQMCCISRSTHVSWLRYRWVHVGGCCLEILGVVQG